MPWGTHREEAPSLFLYSCVPLLFLGDPPECSWLPLGEDEKVREAPAPKRSGGSYWHLSSASEIRKPRPEKTQPSPLVPGRLALVAC